MEVTGVVVTDSGMFGLWAPDSFGGVVDYDTWESELLADEDVGRHIAASAFVPVNIGGDGGWQCVARVGSASEPADLTERQFRYVLVASEPYLLVTAGGAMLSGIEHVGAEAGSGLRVPLPAGRWRVTVFLIDWAAEAGQQDRAGRPLLTALPDFALLINPVDPDDGAAVPYRTEVQTFDR